MGAQPRHDEVRWEVEEHIADVEQCQAGRNLFRGEVEDLGEVVSLGLIHRLGQPHVGADGGADEVEHPERWHRLASLF